MTMSEPIGVRTLGLSQNDPLRGPVALSTLARLFSVPSDADGIGVGTVVDGSALLSHQKIDRGGATLASLIGTPRGRTTVAQLTTPRELRPSGMNAAASQGPFRARTYCGAVIGGPQHPDEAAASRDRLLGGLPDALRRCIVGKSEGEAFFLAVLAVLNGRGLLDRAHDNGRFLSDAVETVLGVDPWPRQVTITNGIDVLHLARGMPSAVVVVRGLDDAIAGDISPLLADSSTARERNRRYVGTFCVGALDAPVTASTVAPPGCTLQLFPDGGAVLVGRDPAHRLL
jgi:hypothetical protein